MKDERKHHGAVNKFSSNNRSVVWMSSAFVMLKIGPIHLTLVGLTAGRPARGIGTNFGVWGPSLLMYYSTHVTYPDIELNIAQQESIFVDSTDKYQNLIMCIDIATCT